VNRTLLLDGDVFLFRAATLSEYVARYSDEIHVLEGNLSQAMAKLDGAVTYIQKKLEASHILFCMSDPGVYWRRDIYPQYKTNRAKVRKPLLLPDLREAASEMWETKMKPRLEADDVMGVLATHPKLIEGEKIIVSVDKDMLTVPGQVYNDGKGTLHTVTEEEAHYNHMYQTLSGDATDGYPGCPGVGPVKAEKILAKGTDWPAIVEAFTKARLGEEAALVQARIARICQASDYNFETNKVILWEPAADVCTPCDAD
jgi:DNA polymerase-1